MVIKTGATVDRFVLWISATDPKWDPKKAEEFVRSLGAHGVKLVDVDEDGVVTVELQGACKGCPMSQMTLANGVERILKERVPGVTRVVPAVM